LIGSTIVLTAGAAYKVYWPQGATQHWQTGDPTIDTLHSIVDTILPEDETVGAISLGIDKAIEKEMQHQPKTQALVHRMVEAVNNAALSQQQAAFLLLDIDQREELLLSLLKRGSPRTTRYDLQQIRKKVFVAFYTSNEGQKSINYLAPNQYANYSGMQAATIR
jgi:hypothetical protein